MEKCPNCKKGELIYVKSLTNLHMTGDAKNSTLFTCNECKRNFLTINVDTWTSDFEFMITLKKSEAEEMKDIFESCPEPNNKDCRCPAHSYLDKFDIENTQRRFNVSDYIYSEQRLSPKKQKRKENKHNKKMKAEIKKSKSQE